MSSSYLSLMVGLNVQTSTTSNLHVSLMVNVQTSTTPYLSLIIFLFHFRQSIDQM